MLPGTLYSRVQLPNELPGAIRLLTVVSDLEQEQIVCEWRTTLLLDAPPYSALSYTWQSSNDTSMDEPTHEIILNGESVTVYRNLFHALLRLGQPPYRGKSVWIDFICIDQSNTEERNHQVDLMGEIYKNAEQVIIWLEDEGCDVDAAAKLIIKLQHLDEAQWNAIDPYDLDGEVSRATLGSEFHQKHYWMALANLFRRRWWSRAWVIQEVLLAKKRTVLCGQTHEVDWNHLTTISHSLSLTKWRVAFRDPSWLGFDQDMPQFTAPTFLRATERDLSLGLNDNLLRTLIRARLHRCALDIDKVFCVYGIALRYTPEGVRVPKANYALQVHEAYTETAVNILQSSSDLHILAHVEGRQFQRVAGLPTWVPDWSVTEPLGLGITGHKRYWAAGEIPRYLDFPEPRIIRLKGVCIGHISMQGESRQDVSSRVPATFPEWVRIIKSFGTTYKSTSETILEAFWRTLLYNTGDDRQYPARQAIGSSFYAWLSKTSETSNLSQFDHHDVSTTADASLWKVCFSHKGLLRLFRTAEGMLGLGTESLQIDDSVWIVAGSRIPLIMRRLEASPATKEVPRYELVGGAYVHGFMHGEALQGMLRDGKQSPLEFELMDAV